MSGVLLDTHALFWLLSDHPKLGKKSEQLAERARHRKDLMVCSVTFWEAAHFLDDGAMETISSAAELRQSTLNAGIIEIDLSGEMALRAYELMPYHRDPIDRFILAAAEARQATLVTADHVLLKWRGSVKRHDAHL